MPVSLHRLTRTSWSSFPAAFAVPFPEQGVTVTIQYPLQRCVTFPIRDLILVANQAQAFPSTLPWCEARCKIQVHTAFSATSQTHPFVSLSSPISMGRLTQTLVLSYTIKVDWAEQLICPVLYTIDRLIRTTLTILHRPIISLPSPVSNGRLCRTTCPHLYQR
jgi:hypothetical protein